MRKIILYNYFFPYVLINCKNKIEGIPKILTSPNTIGYASLNEGNNM